MAQQIQLRRDSAADWTSEDPTLADGEVGFETDTGKFKIGNGSDAWSDLDYFDPNAGGAVDSVNAQTGVVVLDAADVGAATAADITAAIDALVGGAPGALDTLNELAEALGDDEAFATSVTNALALKANSADLGTAAAEDVGAFDAAGTASAVIVSHRAEADATAHPSIDSRIGALESGAYVEESDIGVTVAPFTTTPSVVTGTTDQLAAADNGQIIRYTNAAAVTVTIPTDVTDDLADGFTAVLVSEGAGGLALSTTGVTVTGSANTAISQGESLVVIKTGTANTWVVIGGTA